MSSRIDDIEINTDGSAVKGKRLTVTSDLAIRINDAWGEVQKSSLLEFVCKGKIKFKAVDTEFPEKWEKDSMVRTKMLMYGFIPFGGAHSLKFVEVKPEEYTALTNEKNAIVKVWNHRIKMEKIEENLKRYTDEIELYAGIFTNFVAKWAESLYKHRQKRWQIIANELNAKPK